jgi:hypothetical protein
MSIDKRLTTAEKKKIKPVNQGGGPNYLGKQETVTVPKKWLSDPDHVVAELAYITPREQKILLDANIYGSLKGKPNKGPGGIMSLQGDMGSVSGGSSSGGDNDRPNPHTVSGTSKTSTPTSSPKSYDGPGNIHVDDPDAPEAYEIIGGQKYDVTPATKAIRERAKVKQAILNPTVKKNKIFDPISNSFINPFAPTEKPGFGILDLGLMLATGGLFGTKAKTLAQTYGAINRTKNLVSDLSNTFGFEDPIANMFSGNKKSTKNTTTKNNTTNNGGGGDGIASLENQASGYDEYILLLQKLQSGTISDAERNRYNVLKNMLGI